MVDRIEILDEPVVEVDSIIAGLETEYSDMRHLSNESFPKSKIAL
jgi:hypothetical protein